MKGEVVIRRNKTCFLAGWLFLALGSGWADSELPAEPAEPKPSAAVQQLLEESDRLSLSNQLEKALQATEQAASLAQTAKDIAGKACANRSRALVLQALGHDDAAIGAWRDAAAAWESAGDGPGLIEALSSAGCSTVGPGS